MTPPRSAQVFALAARDLMVAVAAHESFPDHLEAFAKRRGALYASPVPIEDDAYWPGVAAALAAVAPPDTMPMSGLVSLGYTLEGGARGLRSLFTSAPSDKERKRVQRIAALAARVMEIVAGADDVLSRDERRSIAMAMASFGLTGEELDAIRPAGRLTIEQFEVLGELDAKVRRELVRGAWQLAQRHASSPVEEDTVRALAARLDMSPQVEPLRVEVSNVMQRAGDVAALAVELTRAAGTALPVDTLEAALENLIRSAAPPARATVLRERVKSREAPALSRLTPLARPQRLQSVALAWATLVGTDPTWSMGQHLRGELTALAAEAGAGYEVAEALEEVDRYLHQRVRSAAVAPANAPAPSAAPETPSAPEVTITEDEPKA